MCSGRVGGCNRLLSRHSRSLFPERERNCGNEQRHGSDAGVKSPAGEAGATVVPDKREHAQTRKEDSPFLKVADDPDLRLLAAGGARAKMNVKPRSMYRERTRRTKAFGAPTNLGTQSRKYRRQRVMRLE